MASTILSQINQGLTSVPPEENELVISYYETLFKFLIEYSWIYDIKITELFIKRTLDLMPQEWKYALSNLSDESLQKLPFHEKLPVQEDLPSSLKKFIHTAAELSLPRDLDTRITPVVIPESVKRGMIPKKHHEVSHMAAVIQNVCQESELVLDVGSGLGYLGNVLGEQCGLHVLGLESIDERSHGASKMTEKNCFSSSLVDSLAFRLTDSESCFDEIENILIDRLHKIASTGQENSPHKTSSVCMVGLHCCGSLTPIMMKLFQRPIIKSLVCIGCCYHSIPVNDDGVHEHFPMSNCTKHFMEQVKVTYLGWKLGTYGLRLGAQETRARWFSQTPEDHLYHTKNVAYRAIVEAWAHAAGIELKKEMKLTAKKKDFENFQSYVSAVKLKTTLRGQTELTTQLQEEHNKYEEYFPLIEPFTALQVIMQPVIESFIVIDRALYLSESKKCNPPSVIPIFDEYISPRNLAIIVKK